MGSKKTNFYADLTRRFGFAEVADEVQSLYLDGKREEAYAAIPDELVDATAMIGTEDEVAERVKRFADAGVDRMIVSPMHGNFDENVRCLEKLAEHGRAPARPPSSACRRTDIDVVREQFEAANERDFERAMSFYADDVVLVAEEGFRSPARSRARRRSGSGSATGSGSSLTDYRFDDQRGARASGRLVFLIHATHGGTGRASGAEVRDEHAYLYRVGTARSPASQFFGTREEALQAASLPEWSEARNRLDCRA